MFQIMTARLVLRHFQMYDDEALHRAVFGDAQVMRFGEGTQTIDKTRAWLNMVIDHARTWKFSPYAVSGRHSLNLIGYCGLFHYPDVNGRSEIEIGYRLAHSAWGKGYATEAATAVRDYAFNILDINRLIAIIDPANTASVRVAKKLGMKYDQDVMFEGYSHPDHVYVVTST